MVDQTPTRIIDIDADYYTLSLGANSVINFSFATGDITTSGDITGNIFKSGANTGITGNFTPNLDCWIDFNGGLATSTNCTAS